MANFNYISISEHEVMIASNNQNTKKKVSDLNKLQAVIDAIYSKKNANTINTKNTPNNVVLREEVNSNEFLVINIISEGVTTWHYKDGKKIPFKMNTSQIAKTKLDALIKELLA